MARSQKISFGSRPRIVIGGWRPCAHPDAGLVVQRFAGAGEELLADDGVAEAAASAVRRS